MCRFLRLPLLTVVVAAAGPALGGCSAGDPDPQARATESSTASTASTAAGAPAPSETAKDLGRFDERLTGPFCDLVEPGLELPGADGLDYEAKESKPEDTASTTTYVCVVSPSEAGEFAAVKRGQDYGIIRMVLEIARDDSNGAARVRAIPEPFDATSVDWETYGLPPNISTYAKTCPETGDCGDGDEVTVDSYGQVFEGMHRNMFIGMTVTYVSPTGTPAAAGDPAAYALDAYKSFATFLIENLPRA